MGYGTIYMDICAYPIFWFATTAAVATTAAATAPLATLLACPHEKDREYRSAKAAGGSEDDYTNRCQFVLETVVALKQGIWNVR